MIQIDTREKKGAIELIVAEFERQNIPFIRSKLYIGDYIDIMNPLVIVDRKQSINEIAQNATSDDKRFEAELKRLKEINAKMYILIEEDRIDGKPIKGLEDIILWSPTYGKIIGERIYRVLKSWENRYNIEYVFCSKEETGKRIIELLGLGGATK